MTALYEAATKRIATPFERVRVLVLPGLAASDRSTIAIRAALTSQGHRVHGWNLGRNPGPTAEITDGLRRRFFDLAERDDEPIALVGWSLGGLYAHRLAEFAPNKVRSVVTMGSPLRGGTGLPALRVPTASIWSRNDGVVSWQRSLVDASAPRHENIEVRSTHFTLGFDPAVLWAVGDRVRRDPDRWKPFRAPALISSAFPARED
jgi:pimeloyl-ACP methyl ester carboxylesterase